MTSLGDVFVHVGTSEFLTECIIELLRVDGVLRLERSPIDSIEFDRRPFLYHPSAPLQEKFAKNFWRPLVMRVRIWGSLRPSVISCLSVPAGCTGQRTFSGIHAQVVWIGLVAFFQFRE
jgi:hypothetical protein